ALDARGVVAVVPCFDVEATCGAVVETAARFAERVIAVDDGSHDGTRRALEQAAARSGGRVEVLALPANRGKGAAMLTAFRAALAGPAFDVLVTLDADGQHAPERIPALVA